MGSAGEGAKCLQGRDRKTIRRQMLVCSGKTANRLMKLRTWKRLNELTNDINQNKIMTKEEWIR